MAYRLRFSGSPSVNLYPVLLRFEKNFETANGLYVKDISNNFYSETKRLLIQYRKRFAEGTLFGKSRNGYRTQSREDILR